MHKFLGPQWHSIQHAYMYVHCCNQMNVVYYVVLDVYQLPCACVAFEIERLPPDVIAIIEQPNTGMHKTPMRGDISHSLNILYDMSDDTMQS